MALTGAGLILISVPASPASTAGGRDSPSYSGFFHCLAVFDDQRSPYFSPDSLLLCTGSFSTGILSRVAWVHPVQPFLVQLTWLTVRRTCFMFKSIDIIFKNTTKFSFYSVRLITPCCISWIPLSVYLSIHRLLLVAHCQLSSSTMGVLLTPYLSRQHITAYLH